MASANRTLWNLVAGASLVSLVACGGGGGGSAPAPTVSSPAFTTQPLDQTRTAGSAATFTVAATGNGALTYQWQKNGAPIPGATSTSLMLDSVSAMDTGTYACVVTNTLIGSALSVTSSSANLLVNVPPTITTQPTPNPMVIQGGSITLTLAATGTGTLSYQWQKDGTALAGVTSARLTLTNVQPSAAGSYACVVTATLNGTTTQTTSAASVVGIGVLPVITAQPLAAQTVAQGGPATFTVTASASGTLSYQWRKNGTPIPGAIAGTLTLPSVGGGDAGTYTCVVTNTVNGTPASLTSGNAQLTVNVPPVVNVSAISAGGVGGSATFSASATGSGTLSYQWTKDGAPIVGATGTTFTLTNLQTGDSGLYACVVTNTLNGTSTATVSASVTFSVILGPTITAQPVPQTVAQGGNATFTVAAAGSGTLSYQWTKNGVVIPGATAATLTLTNLSAGDAATYACVVTNTASGVSSLTNSAGAALTVNLAPAFSTQPTAQTAPVGGAVTFSLAASSNGTLTYQWLKDGVPLAAGAQASGSTLGSVTATTLSLANAQAGDAGDYTCVVTSTLGGTTASATSAAAPFQFNAAPTFTTQPAAAPTFLFGAAESLSVVAASPAGVLSYQWTKNGSPISGATSATYSIPSVLKSTAATYACVVTNTLNGTTSSSTSASAVVAVNWAPAFLTQTNGVVTLKEGGNTSNSPGASLDTAAQPAGATCAYEWFKDGVPLVAGVQPSGSTLAIAPAYGISFTGLKVADEGTYYVVATNTLNGTTTSTTGLDVTLAIVALPVVTGQPANVTANEGDAPTFSVVAGAANGTLAYQWYKGTVPATVSGPTIPGATAIPGATSATLSLANVHTADDGTYFCLLTNTLNAINNYAVSAGASLTVNPLVVAPVVTLDTVVRPGQTGLVASTQDQGLVTYAWTVTGGTITSAANQRTITYTAGPSGTVTASVTVTSTLNALTGSSTATINSFVPPNVVAPSVAHPGDSWMKAFTSTTQNGTTLPRTFAWSLTGGTGTTGISSGAATGTIAFGVDATAAAPSSFNLSLYAEDSGNASQNGTTTVPVNVRTNAWVTKDGGVTAPIGYLPTATLLQDGRVLITGGATASTVGASTIVSKAAQIYDPATGLTFATGSMNKARTQHAATLLPDGRVLVTGGVNNVAGAAAFEATAEIWDPVTGAWTSTLTSMGSAHYNHNALLIGGKVHVIGGRNAAATYAPNVEVFDPSNASAPWTSGPAMAIGRYQAASVLLTTGPNAGKVLITGGTGGTASATASANDARWQPELYDPAASVATPNAKTTALMNRGRIQHTATVLSQPANAAGMVLIAGGTGAGTTPSQTAEVYNPADGTFNLTTSSLFGGPFAAVNGRSLHTASLLSDGTVLLAGGGSAAAGASMSYELFNPGDPTNTPGSYVWNTGVFNGGASSTGQVLKGGHQYHVAVSVPPTSGAPLGQVVLAGGAGASGATSLIEQYLPGASTLSPLASVAGTVTVPAGLDLVRAYHTATRLADGRILVAGGGSTAQGVSAAPAANFLYLNSAKVYDPATHTWSSTGSMLVPRKDHAAVLLANGDVLVAGGRTATTATTAYTSTAEIWHASGPQAGTWTWVDGSTSATPPAASLMTSFRYNHQMVALTDGRVLLMGGYGSASGGVASTTVAQTFTNTTELFDPATPGFAVPAGAVKTLSSNKVFFSATLLGSAANAKVLVAGGQVSSGPPSTYTATVDAFDPAANTWIPCQPLTTGRLNHSATYIPSTGMVVLIGGTAGTQGGATTGRTAGVDATGNPVNAAGSLNGTGGPVEVYDPNGTTGANPGATSQPASTVFTQEGRNGHVATFLAPSAGFPAGRVLIVGGLGSTAVNPTYATTNGTLSVEAYDPATATFTALAPLTYGRPSPGGSLPAFTVTPMGANGDLLLLGATWVDMLTQIYRP